MAEPMLPKMKVPDAKYVQTGPASDPNDRDDVVEGLTDKTIEILREHKGSSITVLLDDDGNVEQIALALAARVPEGSDPDMGEKLGFSFTIKCLGMAVDALERQATKIVKANPDLVRAITGDMLLRMSDALNRTVDRLTEEDDG